ncbi:NB-ARC domain-containing protein [Mycolicibacterium porcinum]
MFDLNQACLPGKNRRFPHRERIEAFVAQRSCRCWLVAFGTMGRNGGGAVAASGLYYQYLFTIETFLTLIDQSWPEAAYISIDDADGGRLNDPDIVDFAVHHPTSGLMATYQAKSVTDPTRSTIVVSEAIPILLRMVENDSPQYALVTNARSAPQIDHLNAVLRGNQRDTELLAQLRDLAAGSTKATQALATINLEYLSRLRRAEVRATGESADEIRMRLAHKIALWRREHRLPLGARAARILENSLIAQIFSRAAGTERKPDGRSVSLATFAGFLAEQETALAQAAALIEAGDGIHHAPSGVGIDRPEQYGRIVERFNNIRSDRAQLCALVGPSGSGKTRLAAIYAHREHRSYDRVCWIDAESDATIASSIVQQAATVGITDLHNGDYYEIAGAFRRSISRFIGRWLIIFDNATSARGLQRWIGTSGHVDVLVTSTNAVDWTAYHPIPVEAMDVDQAVALLRERLVDDLDRQTAQCLDQQMDSVLARLADRLACLPLALQLAAAHFQTTSTLLANVEAYLAQIDDFDSQVLDDVFDDDKLDRDGYRRTLQAAITVCFEQLVEEAASDNACAIALRMLLASSLLAPQGIPQALVYIMAQHPNGFQHNTAGPPHGLRDHSSTMVAAVRRIRAHSLIDREDKPDTGLPWELQQTLQINEIVQHVARKYCVLNEVFDITAQHVTGWLAYYIDEQEFGSAIALQPHAWTLLAHAESTGGSALWRALLAGNQGALLDLQGKSGQALTWFRYELEQLEQLRPTHHRYTAMTAHHAVHAMIHDGLPLEQIQPCLRLAVMSLQAWAADPSYDSRHGGRTALNLLNAVALLGLRALDDNAAEEFARMNHILQEAMATFPECGDRDFYNTTNAIEGDLNTGRYREAISAADNLLQTLASGDHYQRIRVKTQRIQALTSLHVAEKIAVGDFRPALDDLAKDCDDHPEIVLGVAQALNNVCFVVEFRLALMPSPAGPLVEMFRQLVRMISSRCTNAYEQYSLAVLAACEARHSGDTLGVMNLLERAKALRPTNFPITNGSRANIAMIVPWLEHWLECTQMGIRTRVAVCHRDERLAEQNILTLAVESDAGAELRRAQQSKRLAARWRYDTLGCGRAVDVRFSSASSGAAYLLIYDDTPAGGSDHQSIPRVAEARRPPHMLRLITGHPMVSANSLITDVSG